MQRLVSAVSDAWNNAMSPTSGAQITHDYDDLNKHNNNYLVSITFSSKAMRLIKVKQLTPLPGLCELYSVCYLPLSSLKNGNQENMFWLQQVSIAK